MRGGRLGGRQRLTVEIWGIYGCVRACMCKVKQIKNPAGGGKGVETVSALEIVAIIILCIFGICFVMLWGQTVLLIDKIIKIDKKEKPAPKNEADLKK